MIISLMKNGCRDIVGGDSQGDDYKFAYTLPSQQSQLEDTFKVNTSLSNLALIKGVATKITKYVLMITPNMSPPPY